ncbi:MAG: cupin domain-containing protein [Ilumatobacteraceae bacterium]
MMDASVQQLVERFAMTPLPVEATYFVSTYRSVADTAAAGPVGTAMIGLYSADPPSRSLFHRLDFDEVWHFYGGDPMRLVLLHPDGSTSEVIWDPMAPGPLEDRQGQGVGDADQGDHDGRTEQGARPVSYHPVWPEALIRSPF